jgi:hypothetical protein
MDKHQKDLLEVLTREDGQYNSEIGAYVTAYALSEDKVAFEFEYVDEDNEFEVIETISFTVLVG